MESTHYSSNGFTIVKIINALSMLSDIDFLIEDVRSIICEGQYNIGVEFADSSFLSSHSISVLVKCSKLVSDAGGKFAIVNAGEQEKDFLLRITTVHKFALVNTEKELATV